MDMNLSKLWEIVKQRGACYSSWCHRVRHNLVTEHRQFVSIGHYLIKMYGILFHGINNFPGSRRSAGEGIGYPLQYSWASPVAQLAKNSPAMQETWVQSLGWEDPMKKEMTTHSSILAWKTPMDRGAWQATVHGAAKCQTQLND